MCTAVLLKMRMLINVPFIISACDCVYSNSSNECDTVGGQCSCSVNYLGRSCDLCPINYFSEGSQGCTC